MARQQKKLSKKEMREDPLMKTVAQTQLWLETNGKRMTYLGITLVVVLVVGVMMINSRKNANQESIAELAKLQQTLATDPNADLSAKLTDLADTYKGTSGGAEALFSLADNTLKKGDNESALELYKRFTNEYPKNFMLTAAAYEGQATALANLKKWAEAAEMYDRVSTMKDAAHVEPIMLLEAARCWEKAGDKEKALKRVNSLIEDFPKAGVVNEAKVLQARLDLEG